MHVWKVGLACAFASSSANALIVGTFNNVIAYGMAGDPETARRLLDVCEVVKCGVSIAFVVWRVGWFRTVFVDRRFLPSPY